MQLKMRTRDPEDPGLVEGEPHLVNGMDVCDQRSHEAHQVPCHSSDGEGARHKDDTHLANGSGMCDEASRKACEVPCPPPEAT